MRKIAIVGANGLPAKYGGFETLTKYLVKYLSSNNEFIVYCSRSNRVHPKPKYKNVKLVYSPFKANGIESILFDCSTVIHAFFNGATDIILLGASGAFALPFNFFFKKNIIYNIGGIEWKKVVGSKFTASLERKFKKLLEKICVRFSNHIIIDNVFFKSYVIDNYNKTPKLAEYGGDHSQKKNINHDLHKKFPFLNEKYDFSMSRAKEDMKIHLVIEAYKQSTDRNIVIISNWDSSEYGKNLYSENYNIAPYSESEFMDAHFDDRWNQALFGTILERLNFSDLKIKKFIDNEVSTFAIAKKDSNLFKKSLSIINNIFNRFSSNNDALIINSYLPFFEEFKLKLYLKQTPIINDIFNFSNYISRGV